MAVPTFLLYILAAPTALWLAAFGICRGLEASRDTPVEAPDDKL